MSIITYSNLWKAYLNISRGKSVNIKELEISLKAMKPDKHYRKFGNVLLIFNSERLADLKLLHKVSVRRHGLDGVDVSMSHFEFIDVRVDGYVDNKSSLRLNSLKWMILFLPSFLSGLIEGRSTASGLIRVYQQVFRLYGITKLDLFTSNNRLTELLRMAAIASGLQVTEYLHGICSDVFADYYRLIHWIAADRQISYVNMLPRMPQPDIISDRLLWHGSIEVSFQNESEWLPYSFERSTDVLIVGSSVPDVNYWNSSLFKNDLSLIKFCVEKGLKVVYCAHPLIYKDARFHLPKGVILGPLRDYANSSKVLVGHYSTALFTAHLFGKKILIFTDSFKLIPKYFFTEFINPSEVNFEYDKLLLAVENHVFSENIQSANIFSLNY